MRKSLGSELIQEVIYMYKEAIRYALANKDEALKFAMRYARGIASAEADKFIGMYVNESSIDYGDTGMQAVDRLFQMAFEKGIIQNRVAAEFAAV